MRLHDKDYFNRLVSNIVLWALIAILLIVLVLIVAGPFILAMECNKAWLLLYGAYAVGIVTAAITMASGKGDKHEDR